LASWPEELIVERKDVEVAQEGDADDGEAVHCLLPVVRKVNHLYRKRKKTQA
jgi:hypothetical protein